jgi:hypothetical protein
VEHVHAADGRPHDLREPIERHIAPTDAGPLEQEREGDIGERRPVFGGIQNAQLFSAGDGPLQRQEEVPRAP